MAIKPIPFTGEMVRAILDGKKSMTRRVIKGTFPTEKHDLDYPPHQHDEGDFAYHFQTDADDYVEHCIKPRYQVGDICYVKETWAPYCINKVTCKNALLAHSNYCYRASPNQCVDNFGGCRWHPSMFMPKAAARIWLRVTDVRVERVQDISYDDCLSEGLHDYGTDVDTFAAFQKLWQEINAKRGYGWDSNPWVWVISFEWCEKPQEVAP